MLNDKWEARKLIESIRQLNVERGRTAISQKDEVAVMRAMINDQNFRTTVYDKDGATDQTICPSECIRSVVSDAITNTTKMPKAEANNLMNNYEFSNKDSENLVNVSKEFVSNYIQTGRKLPLGCREESDISLSYKRVEATTKGSPTRSGVDENGKDLWTIKTTTIPAHDSISVHAPCPAHLKK